MEICNCTNYSCKHVTPCIEEARCFARTTRSALCFECFLQTMRLHYSTLKDDMYISYTVDLLIKRN